MPSCRRLLRQTALWALALARPNAGRSRLATIAMIAMTTRSSIKVKARRFTKCGLILIWIGDMNAWLVCFAVDIPLYVLLHKSPTLSRALDPLFRCEPRKAIIGVLLHRIECRLVRRAMPVGSAMPTQSCR